MSDLWKYDSEKCDGDFCPTNCDHCSRTDAVHSRPVLLISLLEAVRKLDDYSKTKGPGSQKITINKAKKLLLEVPRQTLIPCNFCLYEGYKAEPCDCCPARVKKDTD